MFTRTLLLALLSITLSACGGGSDSSARPALSESASQQLVPTDATLAEIYNRSCRSCHTVAGTGAPLTGDAGAWAERLEKGMNTLVDNVVNGFGGMPPYGMCMDCDGEQFELLIEFMAAGE